MEEGWLVLYQTLGLRWTINAGFLIIQIVLMHRYYPKKSTNESLGINKTNHKV